MKKIIILLILISGILFAYISWPNTPKVAEEQSKEVSSPLEIESLRQGEYPGGKFNIQETLPNGSNYERYIASYQSEGLTIYGLLTIPLSEKPESGYPGIIFIHGYIPPDEYSTINSYPTYQAELARSGFVTFKPDLRGHGDSEGEAVGTHFSEKYIIDTLNSISYLQNHPDVDPQRIGYWGHSNGGFLGLRVVTIGSPVKVASFWGGLVGDYQDMFEEYVDEMSYLSQNNPLTRKYGLPSEGADIWQRIDPYNFLKDITIPIQIQHGINDDSVPVEISRKLRDSLEEDNKEVEYFEYQDDHDISQNSNLAWQRTIKFFQDNL